MTKILLSWLAGAAMASAQSVYLGYSSYLGGSAIDVIHAMTTDSAGNVYLTGATTSADFPVTAGAFQSKQAGSPGTMFGLLGPASQADAFVVKLNPSGQVMYATYLGGVYWDEGQAIAVDAQGSAYVLGVTDSNNFPTTAGVLQATNGTKFVGFLTKLSPDGSSLVYSTYLPGLTAYQGYALGLDYADVGQPTALAIDAQGNAYIGGAASAANFPASAGAYKSSDGAFVAKVNANGTAYSFVTYLGGGSQDVTRAIALDAAGNIYAAGTTYLAAFPVTAGGVASELGSGDAGAFVVKLDPTGAKGLYSAVLGGSGDTTPYAIAVDAQGEAVVGGTTAAANFPVANAFQGSLQGTADGFVAKLNAAGSQLVFSTFLGGTATEAVRGLALDASGKIYVAGWSYSTDFPMAASGLPQRFEGSPYLFESPNPFGLPLTPRPCGDAFVARITAAGVLDSATYLSGSVEDNAEAVAVTATGNVWVVGSTQSSDFPTAPGAASDWRFPATCLEAGSPSSEVTWPCEKGFITNVGFGTSPLPTPVLSAANFGSLIQEPVAPAAVVTLFGNGIGPSVTATLQLDSSGKVATTLSGTQVLFNGTAAPLILAQSNQITMIVPDGVMNGTHATVNVQNSGKTVASLTVPVNPVDPALLTIAPTGVGQAAALNQDGSVNSALNPAAAGSIVTLFAVGTGATTDGDGAVATAAKNSATQSGQTRSGVQVAVGNPFQLVPVLYQGPSPGSISALTQLNVEVPTGVTGTQVPVFILTGAQTSQTGVTLAVK
jgi:uncharacterized protein (TIGR03437 family)